MFLPSMHMLKMFANSDQPLFEYYLNKAGLAIVGRHHNDPLEKSIQAETIMGIASNLTEEIYNPIVATPLQRQLMSLAESYGYRMALIEGLDQMPGTLPNPIKAMLNGDDEEEEQPPAPGAEAPPDGGAPPPPGGMEPAPTQ